MRGHSMFENREISIASGRKGTVRAVGEGLWSKAGMYAVEKSDIGIVPEKEPNNVELIQTAEGLEGRLVTEGNPDRSDCDLHKAAGVSIERT
jgi:hypothetical protein